MELTEEDVRKMILEGGFGAWTNILLSVLNDEKKALTEERVRDIVREEIERHERERFRKFTAELPETLKDWANRPPFAWYDAKGADAVTDD